MTRRPLVIGGLALAALALAGCTKPNPGASVFTQLGQEHTQALCWSFDEAAADGTACAADVITSAVKGGTLPVVQLVPGGVVGISVDPVVADAGWIPSIDGQALVGTPIHDTYFRFTYPSLAAVPEAGSALDIKAVSGDQVRGYWLFKLVPPTK